MHHKRKRPKNRRAGCLMCKHWKVNGYNNYSPEGESFGDHWRRSKAANDIKEFLHGLF